MARSVPARRRGVRRGGCLQRQPLLHPGQLRRRRRVQPHGHRPAVRHRRQVRGQRCGEPGQQVPDLPRADQPVGLEQQRERLVLGQQALHPRRQVRGRPVQGHALRLRRLPGLHRRRLHRQRSGRRRVQVHRQGRPLPHRRRLPCGRGQGQDHPLPQVRPRVQHQQVAPAARQGVPDLPRGWEWRRVQGWTGGHSAVQVPLRPGAEARRRALRRRPPEPPHPARLRRPGDHRGRRRQAGTQERPGSAGQLFSLPCAGHGGRQHPAHRRWRQGADVDRRPGRRLPQPPVLQHRRHRPGQRRQGLRGPEHQQPDLSHQRGHRQQLLRRRHPLVRPFGGQPEHPVRHQERLDLQVLRRQVYPGGGPAIWHRVRGWPRGERRVLQAGGPRASPHHRRDLHRGPVQQPRQGAVQRRGHHGPRRRPNPKPHRLRGRAG